jgi:hypothetical protein
MTTIEAAGTTDGTMIEPLLEEVHAAEAAWREGALPRLSVGERLALLAARGLLRASRHHRERAAGAAPDGGHTFEHRVDAGLVR